MGRVHPSRQLPGSRKTGKVPGQRFGSNPLVREPRLPGLGRQDRLILMQQYKVCAARLLPREKWSRCSRCGLEVPEFEFSDAFQSRLTDLIQKNERGQITQDLRQESGCEFGVAKLWVYHKTYANPPRTTRLEKFACPYCGKPLRTARAKQCRFCRRDWH